MMDEKLAELLKLWKLLEKDKPEDGVWVVARSIEKIEALYGIKFKEPKWKNEWLKEAGLLEDETR